LGAAAEAEVHSLDGLVYCFENVSPEEQRLALERYRVVTSI
jgi:hypothetical protein